ncbi:MAG: phospholipase D-like domain-containing protein [Acidiferrobacterales bacterium]
MSKYRFPWRGGNRFHLLVDGNQFFPRMLQAIADARRYVLLEIYLFESGAVARRFIDALIAAAARGVDVRVIVDDFGARGLSHSDRKRLSGGGVHLSFYNPLHLGKWLKNLARDHRKLLVTDGTTAFVGGTGITDEFDPPDSPETRWRETVVMVSGPVIADWQTLFIESWKRHTGDLLNLPEVPAGTTGERVLGRVTLMRGRSQQGIKRDLLKHVRSAKQRVWFSTAYFVPPRRFRRALRRAAFRGVDVRLLLPGPRTDHPAVRLAGRRFYAPMLRNGVRIFEFQPSVLHSKASLCDSWVSIGSSNLDDWNLRWNLDANQAIEDRELAEEVRAMFEYDFVRAIEVTYEDWLLRPWRSRAGERFWGLVDRILNSIGDGRN